MVLEDAVYFTESFFLIGCQAHYTVPDYHMGGLIAYRELFYISQPEFHIVITCYFGVFTGFFNHFLGHIHPDDLTGRTGDLTGEETIDSCT